MLEIFCGTGIRTLDPRLDIPRSDHCTTAEGPNIGIYVDTLIYLYLFLIFFFSAFDPAQPGFEGTEPVVHLDAGDAHFVDVIHTNGIPFLPDLGLGIQASIGHVDFFINGMLYVNTTRCNA